jgi:hypothetical protein
VIEVPSGCSLAAEPAAAVLRPAWESVKAWMGVLTEIRVWGG